MRVEIAPARKEQELLLAQMFDVYAEDFSKFHQVKRESAGRFIYQAMPLYWSEAGRYPFLVLVADKVAGFVFVKRGSEVSGDPAVWDMAEFFVIREARRLGMGTEVARQVWNQFPGRWEVRVMAANRIAVNFWSRATMKYLGETTFSTEFLKDGEAWLLFSFQTN